MSSPATFAAPSSFPNLATVSSIQDRTLSKLAISTTHVQYRSLASGSSASISLVALDRLSTDVAYSLVYKVSTRLVCICYMNITHTHRDCGTSYQQVLANSKAQSTAGASNSDNPTQEREGIDSIWESLSGAVHIDKPGYERYQVTSVRQRCAAHISHGSTAICKPSFMAASHESPAQPRRMFICRTPD